MFDDELRFIESTLSQLPRWLRYLASVMFCIATLWTAVGFLNNPLFFENWGLIPRWWHRGETAMAVIGAFFLGSIYAMPLCGLLAAWLLWPPRVPGLEADPLIKVPPLPPKRRVPVPPRKSTTRSGIKKRTRSYA